MIKPPKPIKDEPKKSPLALRVPCVLCGERLTPTMKKTHACWVKK